MKKKKQYLLVLFIIISFILLGFGLSIFFSYHNLIIREYDINTKSEEDNKDSITPICIVALTDLHGRLIGKNQSKLVEKVKEQKPDIIVFLGDMIDQVQESDCTSLLILTQKLCRTAPVYWVQGNHEPGRPDEYAALTIEQRLLYDQLKRDMDDAGATLLDQSFQTISVKNRLMNLCGITKHYYWGKEEERILADFKRLSGLHVLLCHYPESILWYRPFDDGGLDLALCGHTHGGLIRVPFNGGLYAPEQGWRPYYDLGAYPIYKDSSWNDSDGKNHSEYLGTMIISSGLSGEHGLPRVNNPAEITVVHVY